MSVAQPIAASHQHGAPPTLSVHRSDLVAFAADLHGGETTSHGTPALSTHTAIGQLNVCT